MAGIVWLLYLAGCLGFVLSYWILFEHFLLFGNYFFEFFDVCWQVTCESHMTGHRQTSFVGFAGQGQYFQIHFFFPVNFYLIMDRKTLFRFFCTFYFSRIQNLCGFFLLFHRTNSTFVNLDHRQQWHSFILTHIISLSFHDVDKQFY